MSSKPRFGGEKVRLGDCFPYIKNGYNVRQGKDKGGMPITRIETLSDNRFNRDKVGYADIFSTEGLENHILEDGDILMSHINSLPYLGRSVMYRARPGEVFIHGMNLLRLKADRSVVEPGYAELYFRSPRFKQHVLKIAKKAVNQASFSVSDLKEIEFPLMSLCDQHDVIEKLSSVTTQIEHCQRAIGKLDSLVKSRFVEMFASGGFPSVSFGDVCLKINNGITRRGNDPDGDIVLRLVELQEGFIDYAKPNRIRLTQKEKERFSLVDGDLLFARVNGNPKNVGRCASFSAINESVYHNDHVIRATFDHSKYNPVFLVFFMNSSKGCAQIEAAITTSAGQYTINQAGIKSIQVPLPPLAFQQEFAAFVSQVDKSGFAS